MEIEAVVLHETSSTPALETIELLEPRAGEVCVRIVAASVCATDRHAIEGNSPITVVPCVLGHEGSGIVEQVGAGVSSLSVGDHVVVGPYGPCGQCYNCLVGRPALCESPYRLQGAMGLMQDGTTRLRRAGEEVRPFAGVGALAERVVVRAAQAVKIPHRIPLDIFCMTGCAVMTGLGAVFNIAEVEPGQTTVVVGCGGVGLSVVQGCRIAGATTIIAIDTAEAKLLLAKRVGATHVVNSTSGSISEAVHDIVPRGVDTAFEAVGLPDLVASCLELTRTGGTSVMVGAPPPGAIIPVRREDLMWERRVVGCRGGSALPVRDIPRIVSLYEGGQLDLEVLVGQRLPRERFADAFSESAVSSVARSVVLFA